MEVAPHPSAPHLLVVDDDPSIREALALGLRECYLVHAAATGAEALALLRAHPVVAIILDAFLGEEDGLDLIERFRSLTSAPVLLLTGHGTEALATRALRAKVVDYLKKPVSLPDLRAALARVVPPDGTYADPAARARRQLTEHPQRLVTTGTLATEVGLSERHLRRRFAASFGKSPRQYLADARLRRAADLIRTTDLGIKQIALEVGFANLVTFRRAFKRVFGLTPFACRDRTHRSGSGEGGITDPPHP